MTRLQHSCICRILRSSGLTDEYDERTSLMSYRAFFSILGSLVAFTVPLMIHRTWYLKTLIARSVDGDYFWLVQRSTVTSRIL